MQVLLRKYGVTLDNSTLGSRTITFLPYKAGTNVFAASGDWTPAAADFKLAKAVSGSGLGSEASIGTAPTWVNGRVVVILSGTEITCEYVTIRVENAAINSDEILVESFGNAAALYPGDYADVVRLGLTALPNAAAEAAGGLYTRGTGAGQINQANNGQIDANAMRINGISAASVTTISANQGTTQPVNFTGTGASALVKGDAIDWNGVAVTGMPMPTYTQPTGFLAATFPGGTIANTTNITAGTITTVTNLTNLPAAPTDWITAISFSAAAVTKVQNGIATTTNLNAVASDISSIITILGTPVDESISNDIANAESAILTEGGPGPWTGGGGGGGSLTTTQNALLQSGTGK